VWLWRFESTNSKLPCSLPSSLRGLRQTKHIATWRKTNITYTLMFKFWKLSCYITASLVWIWKIYVWIFSRWTFIEKMSNYKDM
jgi:hypothetical protein